MEAGFGVLHYGTTLWFQCFYLLSCIGKLKATLSIYENNPKEWLVWSIVGFGLFYAPLSFAGAFGPGWLVASTWQITIVAGILLTPFCGRSIT